MGISDTKKDTVCNWKLDKNGNPISLGRDWYNLQEASFHQLNNQISVGHLSARMYGYDIVKRQERILFREQLVTGRSPVNIIMSSHRITIHWQKKYCLLPHDLLPHELYVW